MSIKTAVKQYLTGTLIPSDYEWGECEIVRGRPLTQAEVWDRLKDAYGEDACLKEVEKHEKNLESEIAALKLENAIAVLDDLVINWADVVWGFGDKG